MSASLFAFGPAIKSVGVPAAAPELENSALMSGIVPFFKSGSDEKVCNLYGLFINQTFFSRKITYLSFFNCSSQQTTFHSKGISSSFLIQITTVVARFHIGSTGGCFSIGTTPELGIRARATFVVGSLGIGFAVRTAAVIGTSTSFRTTLEIGARCRRLTVRAATVTGSGTTAAFLGKYSSGELFIRNRQRIDQTSLPFATVSPSGQHPNLVKRQSSSHPAPFVPRAAVIPSAQQPNLLVSHG
uniref:Uncharacterized protein n=1 Tax=Romanomermis culicivorax TaxID=13658 RepID=A0A915JQ46_ROMCU